MDNKTPCYGCERREPLCHSSCEEYKAYAQARADRSRMICSKRAEERMVNDVLIKAAERTMREKKKG
jgi:hypothetical protein